MMKKFCNYLFFRVYWWNKNVLKEKGSQLFSSVVGVSAFYLLNYSTVIFGFLLFNSDFDEYYPKWLHFLILIIIISTNFYVYGFNNYYKQLIKENIQLSKDVKKKMDVGLILYILVTLFSFCYVIICGHDAHKI